MNKFENRLALPLVLRDIHRRAAMACLRECGINMDKWDSARAAEIDQHYMWDRSHIVHILLFETDRSLPLRIQGSNRLSGFESSTPFDALLGDSVRDQVDTRARRLGCFSDKFLPDVERGAMVNIYMIPDCPPFALHEADMRYIDTNVGLRDLSLVPAIEDAFGPEAVEYLDEEACGMLIGELPTMNPHCEHE